MKSVPILLLSTKTCITNTPKTGKQLDRFQNLRRDFSKMEWATGTYKLQDSHFFSHQPSSVNHRLFLQIKEGASLSQPNVRIFLLWEKTSVPRENTHRQGRGELHLEIWFWDKLLLPHFFLIGNEFPLRKLQSLYLQSPWWLDCLCTASFLARRGWRWS